MSDSIQTPGLPTSPEAGGEQVVAVQRLQELTQQFLTEALATGLDGKFVAEIPGGTSIETMANSGEDAGMQITLPNDEGSPYPFPTLDLPLTHESRMITVTEFGIDVRGFVSLLSEEELSSPPSKPEYAGRKNLLPGSVIDRTRIDHYKPGETTQVRRRSSEEVVIAHRQDDPYLRSFERIDTEDHIPVNEFTLEALAFIVGTLETGLEAFQDRTLWVRPEPRIFRFR